MRHSIAKRLLVAAAVGLLLQATSVSPAHAGSNDLVWIVPLALLGAAAVTVVTIGVIRNSEKDERPGGRPRRGGLREAAPAEAHGGVVWDFRRCPQQHGPALVCW